MNNQKGFIILGIIVVVFYMLISLVNNYKENENRKSQDDKNREKYVELDKEQVTETLVEFLSAYLNFNTETLANDTWKNEVLEYISDELSYSSENELYNKLYNSDWKTQRTSVNNTINELISIDNIETKNKNHIIAVSLTQRKNGGDAPDNAYYSMIQTFETKYIIECDNKYKIYKVSLKTEQIIDTGSNYYNR